MQTAYFRNCSSNGSRLRRDFIMKINCKMRRIVCSVFVVLFLGTLLWSSPAYAKAEYLTAIGNYEEYLQYLEEIDDDAHFMYYDYIKEIGEFQLFYASSSADMGSPHHYFHFYQYEILDENQYAVLSTPPSILYFTCGV